MARTYGELPRSRRLAAAKSDTNYPLAQKSAKHFVKEPTQPRLSKSDQMPLIHTIVWICKG